MKYNGHIALVHIIKEKSNKSKRGHNIMAFMLYSESFVTDIF